MTMVRARTTRRVTDIVPARRRVKRGIYLALSYSLLTNEKMID